RVLAATREGCGPGAERDRRARRERRPRPPHDAAGGAQDPAHGTARPRPPLARGRSGGWRGLGGPPARARAENTPVPVASWPGNGPFPPCAFIATPTRGNCGAIIITSQRSRARSNTPSRGPDLPGPRAATPSATPSRLICSRTVTISERFKNSSVTATSGRRWSTRTSSIAAAAASSALSTAWWAPLRSLRDYCCWADSESASVLPVAGAAFQVGDGDEDDFGRPEVVDDLIWKARDQHAPGAGIVGTDRADLGAGLDQRHRLDHCVKELTADTWTPLLVPANSVDQLGRRGVAGANRASHRPRISFSILR